MARESSRIAPPSGLHVNRKSAVPVHVQLMTQIRHLISTGALKPGMQLPTVRQLAVDLSVNPNTVVRAYRELELTGILNTHQGTGTFASHKPMERNSEEREKKLGQLVADFVARAGREGFSIKEVRTRLKEFGK